MDSGLVVDSSSMVDSSNDSQYYSKVEFDSNPGSTTNSCSVADFDSTTSSDSATEEHFLPSILRLVVGSYRWYDQLWCSMYMNTAIVGNLFGNFQIPHNCNTRQVRDLILILFQSLLLTVGTAAEPYTMAGDLDANERSALLENTVVVAEPSPYN